MKGFRFLNFKVYSDSKNLFFDFECLLSELQLRKEFVLKDQLCRSLTSIVLNIAEGSSRSSSKDFKRFLEISLGSLNEVVACLDLIKDKKFVDDSTFGKYISKSENIGKQISGLIRALNKKSRV